MTPKLHEAASAKINLFLHVIGRRDDGYHLLDSLVVFAAMADRLSADAADDLSLVVTGPFAAGLAAEPDNLVLRAARALAGTAGIIPKARLVLEKNLPIASGIFGGSADAAAALRLLCRLWQLDTGAVPLPSLAANLGADVPVCLRGSPARMRGAGEQLDPAPALPVCGLVLVNPGVALGTRDVFRARTGPFSAAASLPAAWTDACAMAKDLHALTNDLQPAAVSLQPVISSVLTRIGADPDCLLARMSGSGATCFGLYSDAEAARRAAAQLSRYGWWCWGGPLQPAVPG
jgi:4-diphosphocytidyl-2-C-methyl-D-erythritol kinase